MSQDLLTLNEPMTLDTMLGRFTYVVKRKRVYDRLTVKLIKLSDFRRRYTHVKIQAGKKMVHVTRLWEEAEGRLQVFDVEDSFRMLAISEPKLKGLLYRAKAYPRRGQCANALWYGSDGLRAAMSKLIGNLRTAEGPAELRSSAAYDVAYRKLWDALPNCKRNCGCGI